jgi:hypothetical protein
MRTPADHDRIENKMFAVVAQSDHVQKAAKDEAEDEKNEENHKGIVA